MGIDIYARWAGQTASERSEQITGFSIAAGEVGYLRESIGGTHAVTWLVPEAFADEDGNLDGARSWYGGGEAETGARIVAALDSEGTIVGGALAEIAEQAVDSFPPDGYCVEAEKVERLLTEYDETEVSWRIPVDVVRRRLPLAEVLCEKRYEDDHEGTRMSQASLRGFVSLLERLEAEGREPSVYCSY